MTELPTEPASELERDDDAPTEVTLDDMLATGATYRRIDYWTRRGWLANDVALPGTGHPRRWSQRDRDVVALMVRLTGAGVAPHVAIEWVRDAVDRDNWVQQSHGLWINWQVAQ